jgi:hypothetical protein
VSLALTVGCGCSISGGAGQDQHGQQPLAVLLAAEPEPTEQPDRILEHLVVSIGGHSLRGAVV